MGPPVKPEGDGGWDAGDDGWVASDGGWKRISRDLPSVPQQETPSGTTPPSAAHTPLPHPTVMLRLDRSIHRATPGAKRHMGPPVKPEGDGGWNAGEWDDSDGTDPIAPRGVALDERALTPLPRTTVMLRLDRSIHGATPGAERHMGPPVKPEGDGGWDAGGWDDGDDTDPIAPRGVALDERALTPLPRTTVMLRLDRSIHGATPGAERHMGPPVKPEGDGGWDDGEESGAANNGGWVAGAGPCGSEVSGGGISDMRRAPPCAAFPAATIGAF
ncbi:hypothetical protein [Xanthobacter sp. ZOL 2024]